MRRGTGGAGGLGRAGRCRSVWLWGLILVEVEQVGLRLGGVLSGWGYGRRCGREAEVVEDLQTAGVGSASAMAPCAVQGACRQPDAQGNEAHEGVRSSVAGQAQINVFFRPDGMVESICDGP